MNSHLKNKPVHGGSPTYDAKRLDVDVDPEELTDFSTNISPLGLPEKLERHWNDLKQHVTRYPDPDGAQLQSYFVDTYGLEPSRVLAGNGVSEMIYLLLQTLCPERTVLLEPTFHEYRRAAESAGSSINCIARSPASQFRVTDWAQIKNKLGSEDLLMVGNPNNPTGTVIESSRLLDLADARPNSWIVVDEAFVRFVNDPEAVSVLEGVEDRSNLIVFRSLTKFYALPGLRAGGMIGPAEVIQRAHRQRAPWMVNRLAEQAVTYLKEATTYDQKLRERIQSEQERLYDRYQEVDIMDVYPTRANFFLACWRATESLDDLLQYLLENGIYVRDARNFSGLDGEWFRFAIKSREQNNRLLDRFKNVPV